MVSEDLLNVGSSADAVFNQNLNKTNGLVEIAGSERPLMVKMGLKRSFFQSVWIGFFMHAEWRIGISALVLFPLCCRSLSF